MMASSAFWKNDYTPYVRTITFNNSLSGMPSSCTKENLCWDISYDSHQENKVYAYLTDSGFKDSTDVTKSLYNLYIVSEARILAPENSYCLFEKFKNLVQFNCSKNFDTSKVKYMAHMFENCSSLTSLDLSSFNTSNVTDMCDMFRGCESLASLDLSNFNTSKVVYMSRMFYKCLKIRTELNLLNSGLVHHDSMFSGALTDDNAYVILGYTTDTETIATAMKNTCSNSSKITLKQI